MPGKKETKPAAAKAAAKKADAPAPAKKAEEPKKKVAAAAAAPKKAAADAPKKAAAPAAAKKAAAAPKKAAAAATPKAAPAKATVAKKAAAPKRRAPKKKAGPTKAKKVQTLKFYIECKVPLNDGILDIAAFEKYLTERIKVKGKTGQLGDAVVVSRDKTRINVAAKAPFSKRYLKYLTKKFLKHGETPIRDWLRVLACSKQGYELRYFNIDDEEAEE